MRSAIAACLLFTLPAFCLVKHPSDEPRSKALIWETKDAPVYESGTFTSLSGKLSFAADARIVAAFTRKGIQLYDFNKCIELEAPKELNERILERGDENMVLALSPDGKLLAAQGPKGGLLIYDVLNGKTLHSSEQPVTAFTFSPDNRFLAVAFRSGSLEVLDSQTGRPRQRIEHQDRCNRLVYSPFGKHLAVVTTKEILLLAAKGRFKPTSLAFEWKRTDLGQEERLAALSSLCFSPDEKMVVTTFLSQLPEPIWPEPIWNMAKDAGIRKNEKLPFIKARTDGVPHVFETATGRWRGALPVINVGAMLFSLKGDCYWTAGLGGILCKDRSHCESNPPPPPIYSYTGSPIRLCYGDSIGTKIVGDGHIIQLSLGGCRPLGNKDILLEYAASDLVRDSKGRAFALSVQGTVIRLMDITASLD